MFISTERSLLKFLLAIGAMTVIAAGVSLVLLGSQSTGLALAVQSREISGKLDDLLADLNNIETGHEEFLLTGQSTFREFYRSRRVRIWEKYEAVSRLRVGQNGRVEALKRLLAEEFAAIDESLTARQKGGLPAIQEIGLLNRRRKSRDDLRAAFLELKQAQETFTEQGLSRSQVLARGVGVALTIGACMVVGLLLLINPGFTKDRGNRLVERTGISDEATDLNLIHTTLQKNEMPFLQLAERLNGVFWTFDPGNREYLYVSRGFERFWGISVDETPSLSNTWMNHIHPDDRETVLCNFTEKSRFTEIDQEFRVMLSDGTLKWGRDRSFPIRNPADETVRVVGMTEDITFRKEGEREKERLLLVEQTARHLSELAEARFRILTESIPGIVCTSRPDGRMNYQNMRWHEYTGLPIEKSIDWGWTSAVHSDDLAETVLKWKSAVETGEPFEAEFRLCRNDNLHRWFLARAMPAADNAGRIEMWIWTCTDIHEHRQNQEIRAQLFALERLARDEAEAANHAKDEFVALVSHELRSPLNAMLGWARILRSDKADPATAAKAVKTIEQSANTQLRLIEDLLDTARIITGKLRLELSTVHLDLVADAALEILRPSLEAKGLELSLTVADDISGFQGDPDRLHQVVGNLVLNAIKFTPSKGKIGVALQKTDTHIRLTVSDNGQGVPPEKLPLIFNRFNQGTTTGSRRSSGLGLGLPLARYLVELHGGSIWAESDGVSLGTTFFVDLPLSTNKHPESPFLPVPGQLLKPSFPEDDPLWSAPLRFTPTLTGLQFLVVDDEEFARDLVATVLGNYGARVTLASSAAEGMEILTAIPLTKFDGIVSDIGMHEEDGYAFIRRVRALAVDQGGRIPAVALTAYTSTADRIRALEAGFQIHMGKPVEPAELMTVVANLSGRQIMPFA